MVNNPIFDYQYPQKTAAKKLSDEIRRQNGETRAHAQLIDADGNLIIIE